MDLLDIELFANPLAADTLIHEAKKMGIKIVLCNHDFQKTPSQEEIVARLRQMQMRQADICKIAVMPQDATDVLTLLSATNEMYTHYASVPIVTMSMGQLGMISRVTGQLFGSALTLAQPASVCTRPTIRTSIKKLFKDIRTKQVIQKVKKVAKKNTTKTNAMRMVEQHKVPYKEYEFAWSEDHLSAESVAESLGIEKGRILKPWLQ